MIHNLSSEICQLFVNNIHQKKFMGISWVCNRIIQTIPSKSARRRALFASHSEGLGGFNEGAVSTTQGQTVGIPDGGAVSATQVQGEEVFSGGALSEANGQEVRVSSVGEVSANIEQVMEGASGGALSHTQGLDCGGASATEANGDAAAVGGALSAPLPANTRSSGRLQQDRRKSVQEIVTDFSSCMSSVSSGEDTITDWGDSVTKRKKKEKREANI